MPLPIPHWSGKKYFYLKPPFWFGLASSNRQPIFLVILWGGVITFLSLLPGKTLPTVTIWDWIGTDKLGHAAVYGIWSLLWCRWVSKASLTSTTIWIWGGLIVMSTYGIVLEVLQSTIHPDRYFEVPDIVANIIGALASYGIFVFMKKTF